jgi:sec-independent protein translocase protein TatA
MGLSFWHIMIVLLVFVLLFGRGKISDLMGDVAKGIKSFKKGLSEDEDKPIDVQHRLNAEEDKADTPR